MTQGRHYRRKGASLQGTLSNWITSIIDSRLAESQKTKINNRAWDLYLNDAMAKGVIDGLVTEVVNTGVTPQPRPMADWLGKTEDWKSEYQQKAYNLFEIWGLDFRNFCDATGRQNIYMLQALAFFMWKLEGIGVFQMIYNNDNSARPLGLSVLPIDPGRLITPTDVSKNETVYDGVVLGKNGEIKSAYILKPGKTRGFSTKKKDCTKIKAVNADTGLPNLLFVCDVRNVAEYRQDSILGSMIKEIKDSNDLVDAAVVKSLLTNLWTAFITSDNPYDSGTDVSKVDWADRIEEMEKGTMIFGADGETVDFLDSNAPGPGYDIMNDSIIGRLGMATGRGSENVKRSYKASFSASQASLENAERFGDYDRMILNNRFCQPIFAALQYEAAVRGILPVTSISHFKANMYAYTRTDWMPPPSRPIDSGKAAKADTERLGNNTRNFSDIYGTQGRDWKTALEQKAIELAEIKRLEKKYDITMRPVAVEEEEQNNADD
jgi:capsid protein